MNEIKSNVVVAFFFLSSDTAFEMVGTVVVVVVVRVGIGFFLL